VGTKLSKVRNLADELAITLNVPQVRVSRRGAAVAIEIARDDPQPVRLLPLLSQLADAPPPVTATLGLAEDGAPLLIRLPSPDVAHILVAGTTGSGKTILLRTMVLSLAMGHKPRDLALVLLDPRGGAAFGDLAGLPHLARSVILDTNEATEALYSLVRLMEKRDAEQVNTPPVVVVIDELADLLMTGGAATQEALTRLTQRGRGAGIHIVAATQKPTAAVLGPLVKANFPVRLVGKVVNASDARTASGLSGTGAERLAGRGDFVAVAEGRTIRFQVAHVSPDEVAAELTARGWEVAPTVALTPPKPEAEVKVILPSIVIEPEQTKVEVMVDRLGKLGWDPRESYRAAARALGEAEGGRRFALVREAVNSLRNATASPLPDDKNGGNGRKNTFSGGSDSTLPVSTPPDWVSAYLAQAGDLVRVGGM